MDTNSNNQDNQNANSNPAPQMPNDAPTQNTASGGDAQTSTPAPAAETQTPITPAASPDVSSPASAPESAAPVTPAPANDTAPAATATPSDTPPAAGPMKTDPSTPAMGAEQHKSGGKSTGLMIGALVVLIAVFVGLLFFFIMRKPAAPEQPKQQVPVASAPTVTQPVASPTPDLTQDAVNAVDVGSPESDLAPVTQDLDQL